ncbi:1315_t:CDS:2, partial [Ambispora leptoticha]
AGYVLQILKGNVYVSYYLVFTLRKAGCWMKKQKQLSGQEQGEKTKAEAVNKKKGYSFWLRLKTTESSESSLSIHSGYPHSEYPYMKNYNYNGSIEYDKATRFLETGCHCGCSKKIPREKFAELREAFQAFSRSEQDIFLMAQLKAMNGGEITASRRLKKKTRIGRTHFENVRNHLAANGIIPRVHGNIKRIPRWKTKITIDITVATAVKNFLENYAEIHGLPSPGRNVNRITQSLTLLPAETSYKSVYRDFIAGLENDSKLKLLKYDACRKLWHQLTPYIQIMSPRTDLCDTCQHFRNGLQYNARKEEEAKDLLKKFKEHLVKAKLERNYYNKNTKLAEQQRKLLRLSTKRSRAPFRSTDEAVREQINYVLDENEIIGKGPNVICGYYESIELNFMVPGHTKFKCDGSFGLIKKLYRKTTVDCVNHIIEVVKKSSTAGLNKAQCYDNGQGFQYLDLNSVLGIFFKKLNGLQKYQHFLFEATHPGVVKAQLVANVKADKEVKGLQSLTTNLEKEKNGLLEKTKQLEAEQKVLEEALELEENISKYHLDALEVARQWRVRQSKEKDDNLEKASRKIEMLENVVAWQNYLTNKQFQELQTLLKKQNKFKLLINKAKSRIKQAKAITQEKFNTYILQKNK